MMLIDHTGKKVLTRFSDGSFAVAIDAGPYPGTAEISRIRRLECVRGVKLKMDDPLLDAIVRQGRGEIYASGYDTGALIPISEEQWQTLCG